MMVAKKAFPTFSDQDLKTLYQNLMTASEPVSQQDFNMLVMRTPHLRSLKYSELSEMDLAKVPQTVFLDQLTRRAASIFGYVSVH